MKKLIAGAILAAGVVGVGGTAFAGEINGSGPRGNPDKGNVTPVSEEGGFVAGSICAFSGLEDGSEPGSTYGPGNVQNWGTIPKFVRDTILVPAGEHPGQACRGFASFGE